MWCSVLISVLVGRRPVIEISRWKRKISCENDQTTDSEINFIWNIKDYTSSCENPRNVTSLLRDDQTTRGCAYHGRNTASHVTYLNSRISCGVNFFTNFKAEKIDENVNAARQRFRFFVLSHLVEFKRRQTRVLKVFRLYYYSGKR